MSEEEKIKNYIEKCLKFTKEIEGILPPFEDAVEKLLDLYISKDKIREKIKKLKEEKEQLRIDKEVTWDSAIYKLDLKIGILEEILEEEE